MNDFSAIKGTLDSLLEYLVAASEFSPTSTEFPDNHKEIVSTCKELLDHLYIRSMGVHQFLSFVISEHFNGEYLMSSYEVSEEFDHHNYFLGVQTNDDGSLKFFSYTEKKE
jgi:hypothetical protein